MIWDKANTYAAAMVAVLLGMVLFTWAMFLAAPVVTDEPPTQEIHPEALVKPDGIPYDAPEPPLPPPGAGAGEWKWIPWTEHTDADGTVTYTRPDGSDAGVRIEVAR